MQRTLTFITIGLFGAGALSGQEVAVADTRAPAVAPQALGGADDASIFGRKNARTISLLIPAPRGQIVDREGAPFAQNRVAYQLAVQFEQFQTEDEAAIVAWGRERVALAKTLYEGILEPSDAELYHHYRHRRWLPLYISSHIGAEKKQEIEPRLKRGLILQPVYQRFYPEGSVAAHIIGYTGIAGRLDTGPINLNEPLWELTEGKSGLEKAYEQDLSGKPAQLRMIYNEQGQKLEHEQNGQPRPGGTVVTTLNMRWQKHAEKVLRDHSRRGAMVVVDVATGEVLAMASRPSFDLNLWIPRIGEEEFKELNESEERPLYGRAYQGQYPPASGFKPIVALAALNDRTISRDSTVNCPAFVQYGNHKLWNWSRSAYGPLSVIPAIKWSNNPWFAQVGNRVGSSSFLALARRLGYGTTTGLPLEGESPGLIPTAQWVRQAYKRPITEGDAANWSIGQGAVLATPLQVAQAMAGIANGGVLPKLHLVMQVQDPYGRVIRTAQPERRNWLGVDFEALEIVREGMRQVVAGGTGSRASLSWTEVCGKTGTGQWGQPSKEQRVAWFAGFLPADEPRLAFACLYEGRPHEKVSGGRNAGQMVPAFFNKFREEIEEMIAPAPKAVMIVEEGTAAEPEPEEGVMRAIPVSPLDTIAEMPPAEEIPRALPVDEEGLEIPPPGEGGESEP